MLEASLEICNNLYTYLLDYHLWNDSLSIDQYFFIKLPIDSFCYSIGYTPESC